MRVFDLGCGAGEVAFIVADLVGLPGGPYGAIVTRFVLMYVTDSAAVL
jgi:ubiquinone/menaquinone biosynthesis C-methylase UbiE